MAWIADVMGGLNNMLGGQGNAISQIMSLFGPKLATSMYNVAPPAENTANALYKALLDPTGKMMTGLTGPLREQNLADFQTQLREMQLGDRRAASMGRAPTFFQPERADEAVSFLTSRGLPQMNNMAAQSAMERILQAAGGIKGFAQAQTGRQQVAGNDLINTMGIPEQIFKMWQQGGFGGGGFQQTPMR